VNHNEKNINYFQAKQDGTTRGNFICHLLRKNGEKMFNYKNHDSAFCEPEIAGDEIKCSECKQFNCIHWARFNCQEKYSCNNCIDIECHMNKKNGG
jgi:hypothetical protein